MNMKAMLFCVISLISAHSWASNTCQTDYTGRSPIEELPAGTVLRVNKQPIHFSAEQEYPETPIVEILNGSVIYAYNDTPHPMRCTLIQESTSTPVRALEINTELKLLGKPRIEERHLIPSELNEDFMRARDKKMSPEEQAKRAGRQATIMLPRGVRILFSLEAQDDHRFALSCTYETQAFGQNGEHLHDVAWPTIDLMQKMLFDRLHIVTVRNCLR